MANGPTQSPVPIFATPVRRTAVLRRSEQQALYRIVAAAEAASAWRCEVCGRADACLRGRLPRRIRTLCDTHADWGVRP